MSFFRDLMNDSNDFQIDSMPITSQKESIAGYITSNQIRNEIFKFSFTPPAHVWTYPDSRGLIENMMRDRNAVHFDIQVGGNSGNLATPKLANLTRYLGDMSGIQLNNVRVSARQASDPSGSIRLHGLPTNMSAGTFYFRAGDYLQPNELLPSGTGNNKVYRIRSDVPSNSQGTALVGLNRPIFNYPATNSSLRFDQNVVWSVFLEKIPEIYAGVQFVNGISFRGKIVLKENLY